MREERLALCLKISQAEWIKRLANGCAWFGKIDNYIKQAVDSGNDDQGDRYEGVFARCRNNSELIAQYHNDFGDDLEIIEEGDYCWLRRRSSRLQKAFCMYDVKMTDLEITEVLNPEDDAPMGKFRCNIISRMYDGFLQDGSAPKDVAGFYCSAGHINEALEKTLNLQGYEWKRAMIQYDIDINQEFYIEPLEGYPELWHKRKELAYQHESRILIYDDNDDVKGIALQYEPISVHSGGFALGQLLIEGTAHLYRLDDK